MYRIGDVGQYFYVILDGTIELCQRADHLPLTDMNSSVRRFLL